VPLWLATAAIIATIAGAIVGTSSGGVAVLRSLLAADLAHLRLEANCSLSALMQLLQWLRLLHAASSGSGAAGC